jgi:hypothetical protein
MSTWQPYLASKVLGLWRGWMIVGRWLPTSLLGHLVEMEGHVGVEFDGCAYGLG